MDLATRLKMFISKLGIANSEFADRAGIPRPTLSQLLTGRNKSVNDAFIKKIHDTYPSLNIAWLLFDEGDMETGANIQISSAQIDDILTETDLQYAENQLEQQSPGQLFNELDFTPEKSKVQNNVNFNTYNAKEATSVQENGMQGEDSTPTENQIAMQCSKKVKSIMVFYSDNSFETFKPSGE